MKKLLLGTAIAMVLATGSYAQTPANNSEFYTADGRFAAAHAKYDEVKNDRCRTPAVESEIYNLGNDITWMNHWILELRVALNGISLSDPNNAIISRLRDLQDREERQIKRAVFEREQVQVWLENLNSKPDCPTPAAPTSAIPGGNPGPTPPGNGGQPPQANNPQSPTNSPDPASGPCPTDVANLNDIIGLIRLHLTIGSVVEQTPAPHWEKETVDGNCTWYLLYYTKDADGGFGWNLMHTGIPCTETPPGISTRTAAGSTGSDGAQYCASSTGLYSPSGDGTVDFLPGDHRALDKPRDDNNQSTDDRRNVKQSDTKSDAKSDPKSDTKTDNKSDKSDSKTLDTRRADSKTDDRTGKSEIKQNNNAEHTSRTVTSNKSEMSQHLAHSETGHTGGLHETGMHKSGGLGGMHGGGLGGLGGGLGGSLAGMLLNGLGGH
jgi:hypothetical protein